MIKQLNEIEQKYDEIIQKISDPKIASSYKYLQKFSKERSELQPIIDKIKGYKKMIVFAAEIL